MDMTRMEDGFKQAIAGLPTYKRTMAWEYVKALQAKIVNAEQRVDNLAEACVASSNAFEAYRKEHP